MAISVAFESVQGNSQLEMVPDEDSKTEAPSPAAGPRSSQRPPPRRGGRPGRGRRGGRGRRPPPASPRNEPVDRKETDTDLTEEPAQRFDDPSVEEGEGSAGYSREREPEDAPPPPAPSPPRHRASPDTIQKAIDEVTQIIETLRDTLDEMDEVLELLEVAERQQTADEQEIESLRRALRGMQRPRGGERDRGAERGGSGGAPYPREHPPGPR